MACKRVRVIRNSESGMILLEAVWVRQCDSFMTVRKPIVWIHRYMYITSPQNHHHSDIDTCLHSHNDLLTTLKIPTAKHLRHAFFCNTWQIHISCVRETTIKDNTLYLTISVYDGSLEHKTKSDSPNVKKVRKKYIFDHVLCFEVRSI
mgnify:FL=1